MCFMNRRLDRGIAKSNVMDSARHLVKILIIPLVKLNIYESESFHL